MPSPLEVVVPAPGELPVSYFVHALSGKVIPVLIVAFRIGPDGARPVEWPALDETAGWARAEQSPDSYWHAHGRTGKNPTDLGNAVRVKRPA
jgi:hypothetical protein